MTQLKKKAEEYKRADAAKAGPGYLYSSGRVPAFEAGFLEAIKLAEETESVHGPGMIIAMLRRFAEAES